MSMQVVFRLCCFLQRLLRERMLVLSVISLSLLPVLAHADVGARALRVGCAAGSDRVEIEPFIAWNDENSPFPQFGVEQAAAEIVVPAGDNWFYSFGYAERHFIQSRCTSKNRTLQIFVSDERELFVIEKGRAIVDSLPVGDTWNNLEVIYILRSERVGQWLECFGPKSAGRDNLRCVRFDPARPNSQFSSKQNAGNDGAR